MTDETETPMAPRAAAPAKGNVLEELVDTLVAPARAFAALRGRGAWPHVILLSLLTVVVVVALRGLLEPFLEANMALALREAAAQGRPMPPEAARAVGAVAWWGFVFSSALAVGLAALLGGAGLWLAARVLRVGLSFRQGVVVSALAAVTIPVSMVLMAAQGAFMDPAAIRGLTDASLGPARFLDPATTPKALMSMVARVDLLSLWGVLLNAIGVSVMTDSPRKAGLAVAALAWGLVAIGGGILAVLF